LALILDTNALSAVADDESAAVELFKKADVIALAVIVLGEYRFGIAQSRKRNDYEDWLQRLIGVSQVLEVDEQTTQYYAHVRVDLKTVGRPIPSNDIWIAALCRQHSLPLLSRDRHFDTVRGITRIAW
jgi:tRNA(fMet)-specific endonuclease VapC